MIPSNHNVWFESTTALIFFTLEAFMNLNVSSRIAASILAKLLQRVLWRTYTLPVTIAIDPLLIEMDDERVHVKATVDATMTSAAFQKFLGTIDQSITL